MKKFHDRMVRYLFLDVFAIDWNFGESSSMYLLSHFQPDVSSMDASFTIHKCSPRQLI